MTTQQVLDKQGLQHYATKMCNAENRKVGSKSLPTALNDIDTAIDGFKTLFNNEYGTPVTMNLENNINHFKIGTDKTGLDKSNDIENNFSKLSIKGNTIQNLVQKTGNDLFGTSGNGQIQKTFPNHSWCRYTTIANTESYITIRTGCEKMMKPSTKYTFIFNVITNNISSYRGATVSGWEDCYFGSGGSLQLFHDPNFNLSRGLKKIVFTTGPMTDVIQYSGIGIGFPNISTKTAGQIFEINNVMLLEGDWSNKEIDYFEGILSVGETNNKITTLSENINQWTGKDIYYVSGGAILNKAENNEIIFTSKAVHQGLKFNIQKFAGKTISISYDMEVLSGTVTNFGGHNRHSQLCGFINGVKNNYSYHNGYDYNYTVGNVYRIESVIQIGCYVAKGTNDWNAQDLGELGIEPNRYSDNAPKTCQIKISNIVLKEVSDYTNYTPYILHKEDSQDIKLPMQGGLKGLSNGICDTIENNKLIRRCKKQIITGNDITGFSIGAEGTDSAVGKDIIRVCAIISDANWAKKDKTIFICDKFKVFDFHNYGYDSNERNTEAVTFHSNATKELDIHISKNKIAELSLNGLKTWFNKNPITIVYELENYVEEDLSYNSIQCWKNGVIDIINEPILTPTTHTVALNKPAQIQSNIEELTSLRNRVQKIEEQYNSTVLTQAYETILLNFDMNL